MPFSAEWMELDNMLSKDKFLMPKEFLQIQGGLQQWSEKAAVLFMHITKVRLCGQLFLSLQPAFVLRKGEAVPEVQEGSYGQSEDSRGSFTFYI